MQGTANAQSRYISCSRVTNSFRKCTHVQFFTRCSRGVARKLYTGNTDVPKMSHRYTELNQSALVQQGKITEASIWGHHTHLSGVEAPEVTPMVSGFLTRKLGVVMICPCSVRCVMELSAPIRSGAVPTEGSITQAFVRKVSHARLWMTVSYGQEIACSVYRGCRCALSNKVQVEVHRTISASTSISPALSMW